MVNSPVELEAPDLERFPRAARALARRLECTVEEGDALYLPAFWCAARRGSPPPLTPSTRAGGTKSGRGQTQRASTSPSTGGTALC